MGRHDLFYCNMMLRSPLGLVWGANVLKIGGVDHMVFSISLRGIFYFPWHRNQIEWPNSFYCLFRKTQAKWGERNCPSFETAELESNHRPLDRQAVALKIRLPHTFPQEDNERTKANNNNVLSVINCSRISW